MATKSQKAPEGAPDRQLRFEATVHPGERERPWPGSRTSTSTASPTRRAACAWSSRPTSCGELVRRGYEVRLVPRASRAAAHVRTSSMDGRAPHEWLEERVAGHPARGGPLMYRTVAQLDSLTQLLAAWFPQYFTRILAARGVRAGPPVFALRLRAGSGPRTAAACCSSAARTRAS